MFPAVMPETAKTPGRLDKYDLVGIRRRGSGLLVKAAFLKVLACTAKFRSSIRSMSLGGLGCAPVAPNFIAVATGPNRELNLRGTGFAVYPENLRYDLAGGASIAASSSGRSDSRMDRMDRSIHSNEKFGGASSSIRFVRTDRTKPVVEDAGASSGLAERSREGSRSGDGILPQGSFLQ